TDAEYVEKFFIPGVRKAGDFRAAAMLVSTGKTLLHNAGSEFPTDWIAARPDRVPDAELLAWIAPELPPARGRARKPAKR
ncbi:MAG: hypothetical protein HY238_03250, partial [Acidobacteria bacterium]|nr:hypothetical protein [Acidobacteriota bacterium]